MKQIKKITKVLVLTIMCSFLLEVLSPLFTDDVVTAQAATGVEIGVYCPRETLTVGDTVQLKVVGTKKKVTWSSSKKSIATVSKKGLVTAKAEGTVTITAKINKKKYTCKIKVNPAFEQFLKNAPFTANKLEVGKFSFAIPEDWKVVDKSSGIYSVKFIEIPNERNSDVNQWIQITSVQNGIEHEITPEIRKVFQDQYTGENLEDYIVSGFMGGAVIGNGTFEMVEKGNHTYLASPYQTEDSLNGKLNIMEYSTLHDNYITVISYKYMDEDPSVEEIIDYMLASKTYKE